MKLNERVSIVEIQTFKNEINLIVSVGAFEFEWHKVFKNKKGRYIKIKDYYLEGCKEEGRVKNFYIKDNLFSAVYKFEEYKNDCIAVQSI